MRTVRFFTKSRIGCHCLVWGSIFATTLLILGIHAVAYAALDKYGPIAGSKECNSMPDAERRKCHISIDAVFLTLFVPIGLGIAAGVIMLIFMYCTQISEDIRADLTQWDIENASACAKRGN